MINLCEIFSRRPFLQSLFDNTLSSLRQRVSADGFCHTSFGELGDVRCYGDSHYPRDAAEAAKALALSGDTATALKILSFHFRHTPPGQRYLPHVLLPSGEIKHNNIQTDTLAHSVLALRCCMEHPQEGTEAALRQLYSRCVTFAQWLWEDRFHQDFSLLDSGNYNEQGFSGSRDPLMDMFSNASCQAMFRALADMAESFGDRKNAILSAECAELLAHGIEKHLFDRENGIYRAAVTMSGKKDFPVNWLSIYPIRWYAPDIKPYLRALDMMWENTANDWGGIKIPTCEPEHLRYRTMGKVMAAMLAVTAAGNEAQRLETLLTFIEKTVRKPENLWPEYWYHHPAPDSEYNRWFFSEFKCWEPFTVNPRGDYTVDSGNCEQSAVFISEILLTGL